jgi:hypothetical protein
LSLNGGGDRIENALKKTVKEASAGIAAGGSIIYSYKNIFHKGYVVEDHSFRQLRRPLAAYRIPFPESATSAFRRAELQPVAGSQPAAEAILLSPLAAVPISTGTTTQLTLLT